MVLEEVQHPPVLVQLVVVQVHQVKVMPAVFVTVVMIDMALVAAAKTELDKTVTTTVPVMVGARLIIASELGQIYYTLAEEVAALVVALKIEALLPPAVMADC